MQDLADWLETLGMSEYAQRFTENGIDFAVLPDLTDQDLKEIGVLLGHRRKLLRAIAELNEVEKRPPKAASPPAIVVTSQDTAERRQVTVMFSDLVGSTALSARMDPEDLREIISAYQKAVAETVQRFGGFVAKYMGDGVLVYFGYPQAHEDDAERAVRAGLELVQKVGGLNISAPLQTRVGIATGLVVVGDLIGSGESQERDIVGETPNLAARLQGIAEPNTVVIAESTRRLLGSLFDLEDLGAKDLRGASGPVQAWAALRPSSVESRFEALRTATTPLVGREEELDLLLRRWEQAKHGEGGVVLISGEPGIGKSRIAQTIVERLGGEPHTRLRFFCSPHHQDSALYPSIAQLERAAGFRREDTAEQRLEKLEAVLAQGTNDLSQVVPLLADLLAIPTGDRYPPLGLTPHKRKEKTLHAQVAQIEGLAARQPVLMVWEDVHWSDPTTRESLDLIIDRVPRLWVLMVVTYRPEFTPPWIGRPHVTMLTLNRLPRQKRAEMIAHMTGGKALPKNIAEQIIDRTDGVPLFIEELTKTVVESGIVTEAGDHYAVVGPAASLAIPTSLHASLLARLDRLAPTREVAQIGAMLGRTFSYELIRAVAGMPQQKLDEALEQLASAELIFRRGTPPNSEYTFKHALVQDAAYSTLLRSRRQQLHAHIAATLEDKFPEIGAAEPQLLAQHCTEAGLNEKAISYWLKAGRQAVARSAMPEAVAQLRKGLAVLANQPDGPSRQQQELNFQGALGRALLSTKGYSAPEVGETYARARALAEQLGQPDYPLLYGQWVFHLVRAEREPSLSSAEQIVQYGKARNDRAAELLGLQASGTSYFFLGNFYAARTAFEQCGDLRDPVHRSIYMALTPIDPYLVMLGYYGLTLGFMGDLGRGRERVNEALAQARRDNHAYALASVLQYACWMEWIASSPAEAERLGTELVALSDANGFPDRLGWGLFQRGWSLTALGQAQEGSALIAKGLSSYRATGAVSGTEWMLIMLAGAHWKLGNPTAGLECLAEAQTIIEKTNERREEAELHRVRGELINALGDQSAAERHYQKSLAVARQQGAKIFELRTATCLARLWHVRGDTSQASDLLVPIFGSIRGGNDAKDFKTAQAFLNELRLRRTGAKQGEEDEQERHSEA